MLHEPRDPNSSAGSAQGYFVGGRYLYEKRFLKPEADHALLQFEGVYKNAVVYINGKTAGGVRYGYIPFFVSLDGLLIEGENTVSVECENEDQPDSRWYSGAGIYRPVWLWSGLSDCIEPEALRVYTLSINPPTIKVEVDASVEILDEGTVLYAGAAGEIVLPDAKLWSESTPKLYTCRAKNKSGDIAQTSFGIRMLAWNRNGFFVNGTETKLRGGCLHHDSGILGAATYDKAEFRRVRKLKEAGYNAIRSSHNLASRAMLDACDYYGVYVIDETWDMWF